MSDIEKHSDRELQEMQEYCIYVCKIISYRRGGYFREIFEIALVETNRELDERKIRKEVSGRA